MCFWAGTMVVVGTLNVLASPVVLTWIVAIRTSSYHRPQQYISFSERYLCIMREVHVVKHARGFLRVRRIPPGEIQIMTITEPPPTCVALALRVSIFKGRERLILLIIPVGFDSSRCTNNTTRSVKEVPFNPNLGTTDKCFF